MKKDKFKKLRQTKKGKYYYRVLCSNTLNELVIDEDPSEGTKPYTQNGVLVPCPYCQESHSYYGSKVRSFQATGEEYLHDLFPMKTAGH